MYYLPCRASETLDVASAASRASILRARAHRFWWRLRLTATDVCAAVRRRGRSPIDEHVWFADDVSAAPRRRSVLAGPARVLDMDDARRRRQPAIAG